MHPLQMMSPRLGPSQAVHSRRSGRNSWASPVIREEWLRSMRDSGSCTVAACVSRWLLTLKPEISLGEYESPCRSKTATFSTKSREQMANSNPNYLQFQSSLLTIPTVAPFSKALNSSHMIISLNSIDEKVLQAVGKDNKWRGSHFPQGILLLLGFRITYIFRENSTVSG